MLNLKNQIRKTSILISKHKLQPQYSILFQELFFLVSYKKANELFVKNLFLNLVLNINCYVIYRRKQHRLLFFFGQSAPNTFIYLYYEQDAQITTNLFICEDLQFSTTWRLTKKIKKAIPSSFQMEIKQFLNNIFYLFFY